jgi:hypothetical protein
VLKTSLLTAAAAFVIMAAAPISSHAAEDKLRQIVVDPSAGGGNGTGDANDKKLTILPLVVAPPPGSASVDPVSIGVDVGAGSAGGATDKVHVVVAPVGTLVDKPAIGGADALDAITADQPGAGVPVDVKPTDGKPVVETAKAAAPPVKDADGLIGALKTGGFAVDIDHRDQSGDYYLVVTSPKDHALGYLLTVEDKSGKVLSKEKIDPTDYGYYGGSSDTGKDQDYGQPHDQTGASYANEKGSGGDSGYSGSGNSSSNY